MGKLSYIDENLSHFENVLAHNVSTMFINIVEDEGGFENSNAKQAGGEYLRENWKFDAHLLAPFVRSIMGERGYEEG
jgi:hypothetical protein|tara:strand:+ start:66 stop:296 length:231 start_codon:yes stop_codon:yes gene_type:complete